MHLPTELLLFSTLLSIHEPENYRNGRRIDCTDIGCDVLNLIESKQGLVQWQADMMMMTMEAIVPY
jgi:hypothetical protein